MLGVKNDSLINEDEKCFTVSAKSPARLAQSQVSKKSVELCESSLLKYSMDARLIDELN